MNEIKELTSELEESFKKKGLFEELSKLVNDAIEMTDDQVKNLLIAFRSPLVIPYGQIRNVMNLENEDGTVDERIDVARVQTELPWSPAAIFHGKVSMGMWRRVVEIEALNRNLADINLSKVMSAIANRVADIPIEVAPPAKDGLADRVCDQILNAPAATPAVSPAEPSIEHPTGFTAKTAPDSLRKKVVELREQGLAFHVIEKALGLRQVRGMTAHRIYNAIVAGK